MRRGASLVLVALALVALLPETAWAWTPGTHVYLGEAVLQSLAALPVHVADLLRAFPHDFLYGSIAADTSIAKKYAPAGRHCHSWTVGFDVYEAAGRDEPLRAFSLGYLAHLAADAVAHNYFVPMQLTVTSSTTGIGHSYWESRFETHLGTEAPRRAHELIRIDHTQSDGLLDRVLSPTIFSTPTNRRIFRGMVIAGDSDSWQRVFTQLTERSRWDLRDEEVGSYLDRSFDWVMDLLLRFDRSDPFLLDPSGEYPLGLAKRVRKEALKVGGEDLLRERAHHHFGMPAAAPRFAAALPRPLYEPNRSSSN